MHFLLEMVVSGTVGFILGIVPTHIAASKKLPFKVVFLWWVAGATASVVIAVSIFGWH